MQICLIIEIHISIYLADVGSQNYSEFWMKKDLMSSYMSLKRGIYDLLLSASVCSLFCRLLSRFDVLLEVRISSVSLFAGCPSLNLFCLLVCGLSPIRSFISSLSWSACGLVSHAS